MHFKALYNYYCLIISEKCVVTHIFFVVFNSPCLDLLLPQSHKARKNTSVLNDTLLKLVAIAETSVYIRLNLKTKLSSIVKVVKHFSCISRIEHTERSLLKVLTFRGDCQCQSACEVGASANWCQQTINLHSN